MDRIGLTKARSVGPIADEVERAGGSIARVFRQADLPLTLVEQPERLMLLRDQLKLLECAAREIGDDALPARLSAKAGVAGLGLYGRWMATASRLDVAIARAEEAVGPLLQSSTRLRLRIERGWATWTYELTDSATVGRQKNEMLALGYMLDLVRGFAGAGWVPERAMLPGPRPTARSAIEDALRCTLAPDDVAGLVFPAELLEICNPVRRAGTDDAVPPEVPEATDYIACLERLVASLLPYERPRLDWLCRHLGVSRRSLQRRLARHNTAFAELLRGVLMSEAAGMLATTDRPVTAIALELGYSDPAHFTRAFARWSGKAPRVWRQEARTRNPP